MLACWSKLAAISGGKAKAAVAPGADCKEQWQYVILEFQKWDIPLVTMISLQERISFTSHTAVSGLGGLSHYNLRI